MVFFVILSIIVENIENKGEVMNTDTIKIFDENNELTEDFDQVVENVLKEVHGDNYFDLDEEFIVPEETISKKKEAIIKPERIGKKASIKDFVPVLFFVLIFAIITLAGYYFLNNFDFTSILKWGFYAWGYWYWNKSWLYNDEKS